MSTLIKNKREPSSTKHKLIIWLIGEDTRDSTRYQFVLVSNNDKVEMIFLSSKKSPVASLSSERFTQYFQIPSITNCCNCSHTRKAPNFISCSCFLSYSDTFFSFISHCCTASNWSCQATTFFVKFTFIDFANSPLCLYTCITFPNCNFPIISCCTCKSIGIANNSNIACIDIDRNKSQKLWNKSQSSKSIVSSGKQTSRSNRSEAKSKINANKLRKSIESKDSHGSSRRSQKKIRSKRLSIEQLLKRSRRGGR